MASVPRSKKDDRELSKDDCEPFPEIDTTCLELMFRGDETREELFQQTRSELEALLFRLIDELGLRHKIQHLKIKPQSRDRNELYREPGNPWPSRRISLDIDSDRYMCERLLRHELGHEGDRWNPRMLYDPAIEERWPNQERWALELAANISLDARLGEGGLGKEFRRKDFLAAIGRQHAAFFEDNWQNPPQTWPEIEELAHKLLELRLHISEAIPSRNLA